MTSSTTRATSPLPWSKAVENGLRRLRKVSSFSAEQMVERSASVLPLNGGVKPHSASGDVPRAGRAACSSHRAASKISVTPTKIINQ